MSLDRIGRYEIVEELGHGSMGVVYKARDPLLDRIVALKTVGLALSREEAEAFEQRFYREAKSAGRLSHANIVTVHDVGKSDAVAYIAMEFLRGQSLREILDSGVVLPIEKIVHIAAQVADGLAFAHASGIVHRDIKPPNIMVLDSGVVKITDFGIALLPTGSRTLAGTVFGSPKYMSPEQVVGRPVDGRADIFSLGAVLYEMLTGFAPFFGGDLEAVLYQVINEMPAPPSTRNKSLPPAFDHIAARALAKHPEDRYSDARAFAADLRNFRELRPPVAPADQRTLERRAIRRRKGDVPPSRETSSSRPAEPAPAVESATPLESAAPVESATPNAVSSTATIAASTPPAPPATEPAFRRKNTLLIGVAAVIVLLVGVTVLVRTLANRQPQARSATVPISTGVVLAAKTEAPATADAAMQAVAIQPTTPEQVASAVPARERAAETSAVKTLVRVSLAVSPWGEVYVDGKKKGVSPPLTELKLSPGRHTIEIRNSTFAPYAETVNVEAKGSIKIRHKFR
jgi:serine/threonine-protein kinase